MSDTDRAWFKKHPETNFRLRRPREGETEELARTFGSGAYYDLAVAGGHLPPPLPSVEWQVMVINGERDTLFRLLTLRNVGTAAAPAPEFSCYAVAAFHRVAIDRI